MRLVTAVVRKAAKLVAPSAPLNAARVGGLRAAGYSVGQDVYVGEGLLVVDDVGRVAQRLVIGDRAAVAQRVTIILSSHPHRSRLRSSTEGISGDVTIGDDAWVGAGAIL